MDTYRLTGDIKIDSNVTEYRNFLADLATLMVKYKVQRVDVSWERPWDDDATPMHFTPITSH